MVSRFDDVRHMADESSARIHRGRRPVRRAPIRTNLKAIAMQLPVRPTYESLPLASSDEMKCTPASNAMSH
ncbi:unnamed protein product [Protopolystoma xenopodis]|uniref:Uncharacterized protein n=1 Tax=Protopolystoma xenopodis TaxID=117903 RepID=A0A448WGR3_9PLAT|nr:unnamed protein product [Protopolystoma xenopodis]